MVKTQLATIIIAYLLFLDGKWHQLNGAERQLKLF